MYRRPGRKGWYCSFSRDERHISLETDDEEQARVNLADIIHRRAAQGAAPKQGELGKVFVRCAERAQTNHTKKYAYDLNLRLSHIAEWLVRQEVVNPAKVTLGLVEAYKADERKRGVTDRTINRYLDVWKKAMKLAVEEETAPPRVLTCFHKLREPQHAPNQRGLTLDEIDRFLKAVDDERYYFLFRAASGSGMRDDEMRHLIEEHIRDTSIVVAPTPPGACRCHPRGWTTKNFRYREIPASADTVDAARRYADLKHATNIDSKKVWTELQRARAVAGIDWQWSMHDLRRAWGSHLFASGQKLADISRWYGHRDVQTTMRYLRVVEDEMPDPEDLPI